MRYVTLAYGHQKWESMAEIWISRFHEIIGEELVIVSDGTQWVDNLHDNVSHYDELPDVHGNLNTSGILLACAARDLAPCLVVTLDVFIQAPPILGPWTEADIALGVDPAKRAYPDLNIPAEHNCAVQWCGDGSIGDLFLDYWAEMFDDPRAKRIPFWEQVVWSRVWWTLCKENKAQLYPKELNWSHWWGRGPEAWLIHYHGNRKWDMIPAMSR